MSIIRLRQIRSLQILDILDILFPNPLVGLIAPNPYCFLIAVLLSARCTDQKVNKVTKILFTKADTPELMLNLFEKQVYDIIRSCGLGNKKAAAILEISKILVEKYGSNLVPSRDIMEKFPLVGRKTASVVLSHCFGIPAFPVDTHIFRCSKRWGLSSGTSPFSVEKDLVALFPENLWMRLHLQIIAAGRKYCVSRFHDCSKCMICNFLV